MLKEGEILKVDHLSVYFENQEEVTRAVDDITFSLNKGETIGIVGESGSGKSVTALSMLKLHDVPPAQYKTGSIFIKDKESGEAMDILKMPYSDLLKVRGGQIAMIFQNPMNSLNPSHRCGHQVTEAILLHRSMTKKAAKEVVLDLFAKVELPDPSRIFSSYPHELSGGQIQRVMIAMAVSCNPRILIADEPTTALDVTVQQSILTLLEEVKRDYSTSTIFISHDLAVISQISQRIVVMYKGKIVEQGSTADIFLRPKHPYTKGLIACRPALNERKRILPTIEDFLEERTFPDSNRISQAQFAKRQAKLKENKVLLEVVDLKKYYPKKTNFFGRVTEYTKAVDGVSFSLVQGETLGLVGESGCGKSTLGKTILKLVEPTDGEVIFDGKQVYQLDAKEIKKLRRDFQIIFQNPYASLNPRMKIGEAILEPMTVHDLYDNYASRKKKVLELLETVGLSQAHFDRYPHQFSGGQRQRICIARTLSLNPKFIICDECVSALDVSVQAQILNLLVELREKLGLTYIFISHDLSVVKHISDRVIVMKDGKLVEENDADSIYNNPQHPYTQLLIDSIPKGLNKN